MKKDVKIALGLLIEDFRHMQKTFSISAAEALNEEEYEKVIRERERALTMGQVIAVVKNRLQRVDQKKTNKQTKRK